MTIYPICIEGIPSFLQFNFLNCEISHYVLHKTMKWWVLYCYTKKMHKKKFVYESIMPKLTFLKKIFTFGQSSLTDFWGNNSSGFHRKSNRLNYFMWAILRQVHTTLPHNVDDTLEIKGLSRINNITTPLTPLEIIMITDS